MTPNMSLRPVIPTSKEDEEALYQMRIACGWDAPRVSAWMKDIESGQRLLWFIVISSEGDSVSTEDKKDGILVGMIALVLENENNTRNSFSLSKFGTAQICSLFVYPQYRRGGLGKAAFLEVEEHARKLGVKMILLQTGTYENNNVPRYEKLGYQQVEVVPDWWAADWLAVGVVPTAENSSATFMEKWL
ncbi:hypothetical protein FRB91_011154 [Serendipita sp. 411]|nr:hypothetical protein FRB91_011154 [Serendipita sp. 411]